MNRRQKIIVSVTGIFLVLLLLVGLTYAYFLTQITGNTNTKSISVSTANLALVYGDGNGVLTSAKALIPGDNVTFFDASGNEVTSKTFSVENKGDDTEYVVTLEDVSVTYASNATIKVNGVNTQVNEGDTTTFESNDFRYTLSCIIESSSAERNGQECNGSSFETFVFVDGILIGNNISKGDKHNYTFTLKYIDTKIDQSADMNKTFSALFNIDDIKNINPYKDNKNSLAYNIINNAIDTKTGSKLVATPPTKIAEEVSGVYDYQESTDNYEKITNFDVYVTPEVFNYSSEDPDPYVNFKYCFYGEQNCSLHKEVNNITNSTKCSDIMGNYVARYSDNAYALVEKCDNNGIYISTTTETKQRYEKVLSATTDELGITHYYRGNVDDNYVNFAGMCWRIVRINGDGSTKLILEDKDEVCSETTVSNREDFENVFFGYNTKYSFEPWGPLYYLDYLTPQLYPEESMSKKAQEYQETLNTKIIENYNGKTLSDMLKPGDWCYNDIAYAQDKVDFNVTSALTESEKLDYYYNVEPIYYDSYLRLVGNTKKTSTLKCNGTKFNKFGDNTTDMYIAALTLDEVIHAGVSSVSKSDNYLNYFQEYYGEAWYTLTPFKNDVAVLFEVATVTANGEITGANINYPSFFRPAINLKENIEISDGNGTITDPYIIK